MTDDAVSSSIEESMDIDDDNKQKDTAFPDAIKAMGEVAFKKYPLKLSNITAENSEGMTEIIALNEYHFINYGYRFSILDILVKDRMERIESVNAFGMKSLTELIQSMQISFANMEGDNLTSRIKKKLI